MDINAHMQNSMTDSNNMQFFVKNNLYNSNNLNNLNNLDDLNLNNQIIKLFLDKVNKTFNFF